MLVVDSSLLCDFSSSVTGPEDVVMVSDWEVDVSPGIFKEFCYFEAKVDA